MGREALNRKRERTLNAKEKQMAKIYEGIEGYADMTAEQKLEALEALESAKTDDTEVQKWKAQFDKASHEASEQKKLAKRLQEQINSKLTDDELAEAKRKQELDDIIAERDALKKEAIVSKRTSAYIALGYSQELAESSASATISMSDEEFNTMIGNSNTFKSGYEQTLRTAIVKGNPVPDVKGGTPPKMTKKEIMAVKDAKKRQELIAENLELFE